MNNFRHPQVATTTVGSFARPNWLVAGRDRGAVVVGRVRTARDYVDPTRMLLAPDCGLITNSRALARAKTRLLVDVAKQVRHSL